MGLQTWFRREYGVIKNDTGVTIATVHIKHTANTFVYKEREYIVNRLLGEKFEQRDWLMRKTYYFYNLENPQPLRFNKTTRVWEPVVDTKVFHTLLENRIIIALNTAKKSLFDGVKPVHILILLVVIGVIIYFAKGGKLGT